jgi:hypothetical protein
MMTCGFLGSGEAASCLARQDYKNYLLNDTMTLETVKGYKGYHKRYGNICQGISMISLDSSK